MDYDKILFSTAYPIDKVVASGSNSFNVNFTATAFYNNAGTIQQDTIANPYGKAAFIRFAWSLDNINFYAPETILEYAFNINASAVGGPAVTTVNGVEAAVCMGNDSSNIYFVSYNGHHGNVAFTFGNDSYSGINHTFYYKWAMFEVD